MHSWYFIFFQRNGKTHGFGLSGPLTVQCVAISFSSVAFVVVMDVASDDFVGFESIIVTASKAATDVPSNKIIIISTMMCPADILDDFLKYLNMTNMQRMKRGTAKAATGPTKSPTLFASEALESKPSGIFPAS